MVSKEQLEINRQKTLLANQEVEKFTNTSKEVRRKRSEKNHSVRIEKMMKKEEAGKNIPQSPSQPSKKKESTPSSS